MARSKGGRTKQYEGLWTRKKWKMPSAFLSAHLYSVAQIYAWQRVWVIEIISRKAVLFKILAINSMEEPLCISSSGHYYKWWYFSKTEEPLGIFKIYLRSISRRVISLWFLPSPVSFSLLNSVLCIYKGCLQHYFCPCEGYSCHKAPMTCHCLPLSSLLYSLCPCITNQLFCLPTWPSEETMLL